ncbi:MAG: MEKHLA domain-containing protein [Pseudanabaena sp. ELA607]
MPSNLRFPEPAPDNQYLADHIKLLRQSLLHYAQKDLLDYFSEPLPADASDLTIAKAIYEAPFMVLSHDTAASPIFTYANQAAQTLFEMNWAEFTALPSRQSAEPDNREERAQLLAAVTQNGFMTNYRGKRIAKSGRKFWIEQVTVWNLIDLSQPPQQQYAGQAAVYRHWQPVS